MKFNKMGMAVSTLFASSMAQALAEAPEQGATKGTKKPLKAIKTPEKLNVGHAVSAQYLLDFAMGAVSVDNAEKTRMQVFMQSIANTDEKTMSAALKEMPNLAPAEKKATAKVRASEMRAMYRVCIVQGSTDWAKDLGRDAAAQKARETLKSLKITATGKPAKDADERKAAAKEAKEDALIALATKLARKAGDTPGGKDWAGYMAQAESQMLTEWATSFAQSVLETEGKAKCEALYKAIADLPIFGK